MLAIGNIGGAEFIVILAIALIFFGPRRLPGIASALGKSLREFRKALNEVKNEIAEAETLSRPESGPSGPRQPPRTEPAAVTGPRPQAEHGSAPGDPQVAAEQPEPGPSDSDQTVDDDADSGDSHRAGAN